jgi:hypothetical protein
MTARSTPAEALRDALNRWISGGFTDDTVDPVLYHNDPTYHALVSFARQADRAARSSAEALDVDALIDVMDWHMDSCLLKHRTRTNLEHCIPKIAAEYARLRSPESDLNDAAMSRVEPPDLTGGQTWGTPDDARHLVRFHAEHAARSSPAEALDVLRSLDDWGKDAIGQTSIPVDKEGLDRLMEIVGAARSALVCDCPESGHYEDCEIEQDSPPDPLHPVEALDVDAATVRRCIENVVAAWPTDLAGVLDALNRARLRSEEDF